jgi:hypothetical protein
VAGRRRGDGRWRSGEPRARTQNDRKKSFLMEQKIQFFLGNEMPWLYFFCPASFV